VPFELLEMPRIIHLPNDPILPFLPLERTPSPPLDLGQID
jgi:hypothetical protein